jgi:hypothetical protein
LHAVGETRDRPAKRVVVSFGPEHAPLEQRQVEQALDEALTLRPKPDIVLFAAFHFDPEAAKDIETLTPEKTGVMLLKLQMNTDLLTDDLKKKRSSNESFWLIGQPDVSVVSGQWLVDRDGRVVISGSGEGKSGRNRNAGRIGSTTQDAAAANSPTVAGVDSRNRSDAQRSRWQAATESLTADHLPLTTSHFHQIEVRGFDYYNPTSGQIESGDTGKIAMWLLGSGCIAESQRGG